MSSSSAHANVSISPTLSGSDNKIVDVLKLAISTSGTETLAFSDASSQRRPVRKVETHLS